VADDGNVLNIHDQSQPQADALLYLIFNFSCGFGYAPRAAVFP